MHADQIEQAVAAGVRGILCDKPLVTSLAELDRVAAACEEIPLAFALDRRWDPAYRALCSALADGPIGKITSLVAYGIPNTINHGCHWYDAMLMLLGDPEPAWVSGFLDPGDPGDPEDERRRSDPPCRAQIGMENGVAAYVTCDGPKGPAFEIAAEEGRISVFADARGARIHKDASEEPLPLPPKEKAGLPAWTWSPTSRAPSRKEAAPPATFPRPGAPPRSGSPSAPPRHGTGPGSGCPRTTAPSASSRIRGGTNLPRS